jgi:hypothetical protein
MTDKKLQPKADELVEETDAIRTLGVSRDLKVRLLANGNVKVIYQRASKEFTITDFVRKLGF